MLYMYYWNCAVYSIQSFIQDNIDSNLTILTYYMLNIVELIFILFCVNINDYLVVVLHSAVVPFRLIIQAQTTPTLLLPHPHSAHHWRSC